jgi:hypothetical protein
MNAFSDMSVTWEGKEKAIPSKNIMKLICAMEQVFTLAELAEFTARGTLPLARIATTYGVALRFAGFAVSDEDVFMRMFDDESGEGQIFIVNAVIEIMTLMLPPKQRRAFRMACGLDQGTEEEVEEAAARMPKGKKSNPAKVSSKTRTKPRSAKTS